jgi:hypothetical protein
LIVAGYSGTYIDISTDGTAGNSGPVEKTWYVGRITLTPARDTNAIGEPHEIVAKVEYSDDGTNWTIVPDGTTVTFSLSNNVANAYFVGGVKTNTTVGGYASAFINADSPGTVNIGASSNFTVSGIVGTFSASTGTGFSGSDVSKTYVKARITIEADDTNAITVSHTFTITLERDLGDGNGYVPFINQTVNASLTGVGFFMGSNTQTTDANGEATVTINSNDVGVSTVSATFEGEIVAGYPGTKVMISTDGTSDNSGPAVKTYVDARITIKNPGDNVVGHQHTFTILLERDLGDDNGFVPFSGQTVNVTLSGVGYFVGGSSKTTDINGEATVTINSNDPGLSTVSASFEGEIVAGYDGTYIEISTDGTAGNSGPVEKTWWVGRITLTPATATNGITEKHKIMAKVEYTKDGTNWTIVPDGTLVTFSLSNNVPNAYFVDGVDNDTTVSGYASVFINADSPGTVTIGGSSSFNITGVVGTFTASTGTEYSGSNVTKTYVSASLFWAKYDYTANFLGGATFLVTRTHDRFGNNITAEKISVVDNATPDADPDDGQFLLKNLKFGTYTINETVAPPGYVLDHHVETVNITDLSSPLKVVTYVWVNKPGITRLAPTGVDAEDFLAGTGDNLTLEVNKVGKVSPGGFFYYSYFTATGNTTIKVITRTDPYSADDPIAQGGKVFIINNTTGVAENIGAKEGVDISISFNVVTIYVPEEYAQMSNNSKLLVKVHYKPPKSSSEGTKFIFETKINGYSALTAEVTVVKP